MSFTDTSSAKKYASIAETAAAQAKLYANKLELAPNYAEQAATSATAAAASAQVAVNAEGVVNNLVVSASESATSAAESAAQAGNAAAAAVGQCVRVPEGELVDTLPSASGRASSFLLFDSAGNATVLSKDDVAILDSEGKVPVSMIPAIAITQPFVVSSQAAMLALNAQVGDVAKRTDKGFSFILSAEPASTLSNWVQLNDDVLAQLGLSSGAAQVGALDDAGGATTVQGALNLKATTASVTSTDSANRAWTNENFVDSTYKKLQTGNFATGFTITNQFQVVFYPTDGFWYRYLGTLSGGGLTLPAGSSPDSSWENINKQQIISLRKLNELSTQSIAGYIGVNIDMPVSVKDSDNQGAKISSGVCVTNPVPNANIIRATKIQSVFRIDGDNVTIRDVVGLGSAASDNAATSEFITTRMRFVVDGLRTKGLRFTGIKASKFTTGISVTGCDDAVIKDCDFEDMQYSPVTLGSAGGYGVLTGASNGVLVDGLKFKANAYGRHAVYISNVQPYVDVATSGSLNTTVRNCDLDYTLADLTLSDSGFVPIHVRPSENTIIEENRLKGSASLVSFSNDQGPISKCIIRNNRAVGLKSGQGRVCAAFNLGRSGIPNPITDIEVSGNYSEISKGPGQADGNDQAGRFIGHNGLRIVRNHCIQETGAAYLLDQCSNFFIDEITDVLTNTANPAGAQTIYLNACSNGTIGSIKTNRPAFANGKSNIVGGLATCSEVTCNFQRYIEFTLTNGAVSLIDDAFDMISSGGISIGNGFITVALRAHVTDRAVAGCTVYTRTSNGVILTKSAINGKTITINFLVSSTGAPQAMSAYTGR
ncbi:right-handed parallel beta-helix repeat-containing protein, partial [Cronobacter sakazakii]|nr:right-handed parallel beta-helix repeat-containing protein [Cronobacter sakazakii]